MKKLSLILMPLTLALSGSGQRNNRIEFGLGGYHLFGGLGYHHRAYNLAGLTYHRQVSGPWSLRLGATTTTLNYIAPAAMGIINTERLIGKESVGKILGRGKYYLFDLAASYRFFAKNSYQLSAFAGLSMAHSHNLYLREHSYSPSYSSTEWSYETYSGALAGLRYDNLFWDDRLSIGLEVQGRYYAGDFPCQINYEFRIGYNF